MTKEELNNIGIQLSLDHISQTCGEGDQGSFLKGFDSAVSLLLPRLEEAEKTIKQMRDHCLCHRNIKGFDYGEDHKNLGKPVPGARWLTPKNIAEMYLEKKN